MTGAGRRWEVKKGKSFCVLFPVCQLSMGMMEMTDTKTCEIIPKTVSIYVSEFSIVEAKESIFRFLSQKNG